MSCCIVCPVLPRAVCDEHKLRSWVGHAKKLYNTNKMKFIPKHLALIAASAVLTAQTASAAFTFTDGDVVLGFQTTGTGNNKNVFFNLGAGTALRDGNTVGLLGNISTTLIDAYGANWYTRGDVYFGAIGNLSFNNTGFNPDGPVNGDPAATVYLSRPTSTIGGSQPYNYGSPALRTGGARFASQEDNVLISGNSLALSADNSAVLNLTTASNAAKNNSWTTYNTFLNGFQGTAYDAFTGGIQNILDGSPGATFIDIQRIIPTTTGANPSQPAGIGNIVSTIALGPDGSITAIPEPSTGLLAIIAGVGIILRRRRK